MVDSSPPQNLTISSSETAYSFPPYRRRPLRSRTYDVLIQILSHCPTGSPQPKLQVDSGDFESIPVSDKDGSITHNESNPDVIVPFPVREGSKNMTVQEDSNDENKENTGLQDGGFDDKQAPIPNLYHAKLVTGGELEVAPSNRISVEDYMVVENLMGDFATHNADEQENSNKVLDIQMGDFEESRDKDTLLENMPKDAEQKLHLKEMELEKLIHNSGMVESSFHPNTDEEIEEGEISGEAGVAEELIDGLSDDAASLEKKTMENMHASEDHFENDEQHKTFDFSVVNSGSNSMKMERRAPAEQMQDCLSQNVLHDNHTKTLRSGAITPCLENLTPRGRSLQENAAGNQSPSTTENDDCASNKKRKRGPLTKEKREKKKKNKRLKRAAKNRELGVKRLKLQPVIKEKKIVYCRHYLQGRCHEGDKCNFSHDTIPLTKSKPCSHFARHSCMKGEECPFDHQLSKYPCTNYASNGFCIRGSDCLFSHEVPAKSCSITPNVSKHDLMSEKGGSDPKSKVTKPELKFLSPSNNTNPYPIKHMDNLRILHQKVDAIISPASKSPAKAVPRAVVQPPRGVSFLSNKGKSSGDTNKEKRDESSTKTPDGVNIGSKSMLKVPGGITELSKVSEVAALRKPRGINFLSFGQPSTDDSSSKIISNLLSKEIASFQFNRSDASSSVIEKESTNKLQGTFKPPSLSFAGPWDQSTGGQNANSSTSFKNSLFSNTPSLVQKAVQSTLSFAAQLEPDIKVGSSHPQ